MTSDERLLAEIEAQDSPAPPDAGAALALTLAVVSAGLLLIGLPVVLILFFT